ncbi:hypothetical protein GWK47_051122 [Chionoecetes opilio]|uniref:Uncharacterized protein n=1 Tax=Chionoecetes opilio TaxID=41210 RepID=A0A8J4Y7Q8_CHIOP|nr:hypothetical protein GWK47_051122 [Chionoecetes opilio]
MARRSSASFKHSPRGRRPQTPRTAGHETSARRRWNRLRWTARAASRAPLLGGETA